MATDTIELSRIFPATPRRIYAAWVDAAEHTAMTGSPATVEAPVVGGRFTAWDGYIDGSFLALEPDARIVQSWRSDDFPADALDSLLEVRLEPAPGGTRVTLRHSDLPEGQGPALLEGWEEFYFEPMDRYFGKARPRPVKRQARAAPKVRVNVKARAKARPPARKAAPRKPVRIPAWKPIKRAVKKGASKRAAGRPRRSPSPRRPAKGKGARRR